MLYILWKAVKWGSSSMSLPVIVFLLHSYDSLRFTFCKRMLTTILNSCMHTQKIRHVQSLSNPQTTKLFHLKWKDLGCNLMHLYLGEHTVRHFWVNLHRIELFGSSKSSDSERFGESEKLASSTKPEPLNHMSVICSGASRSNCTGYWIRFCNILI